MLAGARVNLGFLPRLWLGWTVALAKSMVWGKRAEQPTWIKRRTKREFGRATNSVRASECVGDTSFRPTSSGTQFPGGIGPSIRAPWAHVYGVG